MKEISLKCFLDSYMEYNKNGGRFCFILGAGASKESGIPTGTDLCKVWYNEINEMYSETELEDILKQLGTKDLSAVRDNYFDMYDIRFFTNPQNGYSFIEKKMERAKPSPGYYPLARQLAETNNNLVITTNFDSLVEDSLFIYTDKRPVVIDHELLANYIKVNSQRPIIAKIHRGLFFDPLNRKSEMNGLSKKWTGVLRTVFSTYIPVVIGYSGGDNNLMGFLSDKAVEMKGLYWCSYKEDEQSDEIIKLVESKKGCFVPIDGFDSLMFTLSEKSCYDNPRERIIETANIRVKLYEDKYKEFSNKIKSFEKRDEDQSMVADMLNKANIRSIEYALSRLDKNPDDRDALISLAYSYLLDGKYKEAINFYSKVIHLKPDDAEAYYNRGNAYNDLKEYRKAIDDYDKTIDLKPDYAEVYNNRGNAYADLKEYKEAVDDYNKAIKLKPDAAKAYNNRGVVYFELREYKNAVDDYNKAIELKPDNAEAYNNRGIAYDDLKEYEKAFDDFNKAIELDPEEPLVYNNRGFSYYQLKEYEKALKDVNKSIELSIYYGEAYDSRGCIYMDLEEFDKALEDFDRAIELDPRAAEFYFDRGNLFIKTGEHNKAISDLDKAIELNSEYERAYRTRAEVFKVLGEKEKAETDITKADSLKEKYNGK